MKSFFSHSPDHFRGQIVDNFTCHSCKIVFGFPSPVASCLIVDELRRPALSYLLSERINIIIDTKARYNLCNLSCDLFRRKAHRMYVVACPDGQILSLSLHQLNGSIDGIISVDHRQRRIFLQIATKFLFHYCLMVDIDCVVCSASSRGRAVTYQTWIAETSDINTITIEVVVAPQLTCHLSNSIDCLWLLNCMLWTAFGAVRPKSSDRRWPEYLLHQSFSASLKSIEQSIHIYFLGQERIDFPGC